MAATDESLHEFPDFVVRDSREISTSVDYGLLRTTREGLFSTILPGHTQRVTSIVRKHFPDLDEAGGKILDATANIGGDAANFAHNFPKAGVVAIEISPANLQALEHNIRALGFEDRIEAVGGSSLSAEPGGYTFAYFDPPWGGSDVWKATKNLMLYMETPEGEPVTVVDAIVAIRERGVADSIILKAPPNFDHAALRQSLERCVIHKEVVRKRPGNKSPVAYAMYIIKDRATAHPCAAAHPCTAAHPYAAVRNTTRSAAPASKPMFETPGHVFGRLGEWLRSTEKNDTVGANRILRLVETFLAKRLRGARNTPIGAKIMARNSALEGFDDGTALINLSSHCSRYLNKAPQTGRAASRVADIAPTLKALTEAMSAPVRKYLDIGCAEGQLTRAFGETLGLGPADIHGCDIDWVKSSEGFKFTPASSEKLPYADDEFQVVSFVMSLHHLTDLETSLGEARRVLAPGGILLIREHNCRDEYFALFLDLVHYMYAAVIGDEVRLRVASDFEAARESLVAYYRPKEEWARLIEAAGFVPAAAGGASRTDMFNSYYAFFTG